MQTLRGIVSIEQQLFLHHSQTTGMATNERGALAKHLQSSGTLLSGKSTTTNSGKGLPGAIGPSL